MSTELVELARAGDEAAFSELVEPYRRELAAHCYRMLGSLADAEDQVQETMLSAWRGIDGFEGRASFKTWAFRILTNLAMRAGARERRSVPFSALAEAEETGQPSVDPDRFLPADHPLFPGHWTTMPTHWPAPEAGLLAPDEVPHEQGDVIGAVS